MNRIDGETRGEGLNRTYTTKDGDTLESIAAYFYGSRDRRDALIERNPALQMVQPDETLNAGMTLRAPDESGVSLTIERGITTGEGAARTYVTDKGDTLEKLAGFFYGDSARRDRIESENPEVAGLDPNATLPPGLTLRLPE